MGKHGKKQTRDNRRGRTSYTVQEEDEDGDGEYPITSLTTSVQETCLADYDQEIATDEEDKTEKEIKIDGSPSIDSAVPSKFSLYQQSVQSPKGDISYLQKFFLMYVGGRVPLHLQEDFCGTALLSVEWLHGDARRTAVGLDLDDEALNWCMENNVNRIGADISSRISLFSGNVLKPRESELVNFDGMSQNVRLKVNENDFDMFVDKSTSCGNSLADNNPKFMKDAQLPARDVVCAFNYSCCCLHTRKELVLYFKHALNALSKKGGIFAMDLYGGTSSENALRLQRRFPNFTYIWEQSEFDIIQRMTKISLHFNLLKHKRKLRHAFSYRWRLWSLPEIKDCLEEAGFCSVHFWVRCMPDSELVRCIDGLSIGEDVKYEETTSFKQQDSWNAYIVGVA